jgi:hypothetical protein
VQTGQAAVVPADTILGSSISDICGTYTRAGSATDGGSVGTDSGALFLPWLHIAIYFAIGVAGGLRLPPAFPRACVYVPTSCDVVYQESEFDEFPRR